MRLLVSGRTQTFYRIEADNRDVLGRLMTPAGGVHRSYLTSGLPWAVDNGAFTGFDEPAFHRMLVRLAGQPRCLFIVAPDVVGDAVGTAALFAEWGPAIRAAGSPVAFVGQDGQERLPVPWDSLDAWFSSVEARRGSCRRPAPSWRRRRNRGANGSTWAG